MKMLKNNNQQVIKRMAKTSFFRNKGKNLVLVAEASSAEIAEDVCGRLEERLRALSAQNSSGQLDINRENR